MKREVSNTTLAEKNIYIDINNWYFSREDKTEKNWKLSRRSYSRITSQRELKAILHFELTFRVESLITVRLGVQI